MLDSAIFARFACQGSKPGNSSTGVPDLQSTDRCTRLKPRKPTQVAAHYSPPSCASGDEHLGTCQLPACESKIYRRRADSGAGPCEGPLLHLNSRVRRLSALTHGFLRAGHVSIRAGEGMRKTVTAEHIVLHKVARKVESISWALLASEITRGAVLAGKNWAFDTMVHDALALEKTRILERLDFRPTRRRPKKFKDVSDQNS